MPREQKTFMVEDAQLIWRNFAGKEGKFNAAGTRTFCVLLDQESAEAMAADGWPVKFPNPRENGDERDPYIEVVVKFGFRPPRITMITSSGRVQLDEETCDVLDYADIAKADLVCNAHNWQVGDKAGIKPYLKTLFVTIEEDELERKYGITERDAEVDR